MMRIHIRYVALLLAISLPRLAAAQAQDVVVYYHLDAVGSVRAITDANAQEVERRDFLPFGEQWPPSAPSNDSRQFTSQERDVATGFDYLGARYYQSQLGRFTRPDDSGWSDPSDPRTLALYVYVSNNPLRYDDPTGHCPPSVNFCIGVLASDDAFWIWESLNRMRNESMTRLRGMQGFGWDAAAWGDAAQMMFSKKPQIDAWDRGYYQCLGERTAGGATAPLATHTAGMAATNAVESEAPRIAGAYYHLTDKRFTAWGKYSKVMVPSLAPKIATAAKALDVAGWAYFDYELAHAISECSELLH